MKFPADVRYLTHAGRNTTWIKDEKAQLASIEQITSKYPFLSIYANSDNAINRLTSPASPSPAELPFHYMIPYSNDSNRSASSISPSPAAAIIQFSAHTILATLCSHANPYSNLMTSTVPQC